MNNLWPLVVLAALGLVRLGWGFVNSVEPTAAVTTDPPAPAPAGALVAPAPSPPVAASDPPPPCRALRSAPAAQRSPGLRGPLGAVGDDPIGQATGVDCLALRDTDHPLRFVGLSAGEVTMGSPATEDGRWPYEGPQHRVRVPAFFAGQTEVTQRQWAYVAGTEPGRRHGLPENPSSFTDDPRNPVEGVTWCDALRFAAALSELDGIEPFYKVEEDCESTGVIRQVSTQGYRLPTEAEWEYLARAGTTTAYSFGEDPEELCTYANVADRTVRETYEDWSTIDCEDGFAHTAPVGSLRPGPWGLFDVHGNVWEWTLDPWVGHYRGREHGERYDPVDLRYEDRAGNPVELADPTVSRVLRGGSWYFVARYERSAVRNYGLPWLSVRGQGFRLVLPAASEP
ncbi:MAG: formylglycine-generating enzyme family protein [Alphaproteobacteria bacterium]|nr:formylglycine-generating enzyme family protein [Alphaproteobacteria bacterium]